MRIEIWSDVVCPWCYIGKRRLERAIASTGLEPEIVWRSFQLDPSAPDEPVETVAEALSPAPKRPAAPEGESALSVRWQSASVPAVLLGIPGVTATDSRTVQARGRLPALYRQFGVWMRVAASLTSQPPYC